jgi:hypothetical protein
MRLSTYRSGHRPALFVTVRAVEAQSVIAMADELSWLGLKVVRANYVISVGPGDTGFCERVSAAIAETGYAVHGFERAVDRRSEARRSE